MSVDFKRKIWNAFAWSFLQSWANKFLSLLLFFVLTRYLAPEQMGLAQSVTVLLLFVAIISEQGFHSALVQRERLHDDDVNLPFFIAISVAFVASLAMLLFADTWAVLLKEPTAANLIRLASLIPPITAANGFLVAMLRRELNFESIARASLSASFVSGTLAIFLVTQGWGPMALVIQAAVSGLVMSLSIWTRPGWKPSLRFVTTHFKGILRFSTATFSSQLIDFFSGRLIDVIILSRYGLTVLGIFVVGAKLYLTLIELLATSLVVVAMSSMAKLLGDRVHLKITYLRFLFLAASTTLPLFVGISVLAPEICSILFGDNWGGAVSVAQWLCLLGAVQAVQFFNAAALDATGNPRATLIINLTKLCLGASVLALYPADSISHLTLAYVLSQVCVSPLSFGMAMRVTGCRLDEVLSEILPGLTAASMSYVCIELARSTGSAKALGIWPTVLIGSVIFSTVYVASLLIFNKNKVVHELRPVIESYKNCRRLVHRRTKCITSLVHQIGLLSMWQIARGFLRALPRQSQQAENVIFVTGDTDQLIGSRGDAAMLESALCILDRSPSRPQVFLACASPKASRLARGMGRQVFEVWGGVLMPIYFVRSIAHIRPKAGLFMGADIMDGHYSAITSLRMLIAADLLAKSGVSSRFLGFSLNAKVPPLIKLAFRRLDKRVQVNLRDPLSLQRHRDIAGDTGQLVADTAFLLTPSAAGLDAANALHWVSAQRAQGRIVLGINFHPLLFRKSVAATQTAKLAASLSQAMAIVQHSSAVSWLLVPHDDRVETGDIAALATLNGQLPPQVREHAYCIAAAPAAGELRTIAGALDGVVAGRMHLAIAALGQGVPAFTFTYQGKFEGLMQHFQLPQWVVIEPNAATDATMLAAAMLKFIDQLPTLRLQVRNKLPSVLTAAGATFRGLQ